MSNFKEEVKDLFDVGTDWALAHCVGNDFVMGRGIAVKFKEKFGHQQWLINNSEGVGTALLLPASSTVGQNVFYLVTKPFSKTSKPTYDSITKSLVHMFSQAKTLNIKKIAMPKIGCGLDGKDWNAVREIIKEHQPEDVEILIAYI